LIHRNSESIIQPTTSKCRGLELPCLIWALQDPLPILEDIADFLELTVPYTQKMLDASGEKANPGSYFRSDKEELEIANSLLSDFYHRPNLELYKLLHETGHAEFTPFDETLLNVDTLDCMDPDVTSTGVCGDENLRHHFDEEWSLSSSLISLRLCL